MTTKRTYDNKSTWNKVELVNKKLNVSYMFLVVEVPLKNESNGSGRIPTNCVTDSSTSHTARHPMMTYVGVWSFLDTQ